MLGELLGKLITAPIKIIVMPIRVIGDLMKSQDGGVEAITDSIEKQVKEIIE